MAKPELDRSFDHDYDGIQEFDNPLPKWWVWLFVGCVVYAAIYIPFYHAGPGDLPNEAYAADMQQWLEEHPPVPLPAETELVALAKPEVIDQGRTVFQSRCAACHAPDGGGLVGPNLTDDFAIHGFSRERIVRVVHDGVPAKGMIAWNATLSRDELLAVSLFVYGLRGTKPANPKAPQGEPIQGNGHGNLGAE